MSTLAQRIGQEFKVLRDNELSLKASQTTVDVEVTRAINAETTLSNNISVEITRATSAETTLTNNLNAEITARTNADTTLTNNLNAEITRATSAETTLTNNLNAEITARIAADNTLQAAIDTKISGSGVTGDILYHNGTSFVKLAAGTTGQILRIGSGGLPEWADPVIQ